jgi:phosphocarrier protein HPr
MIRQEVEIVNKLGLHARASTKLTQVAGQFDSQVWIERGSRRVNAKSIMGVMMLAASKGSKVTLEANGNDENDAMSQLLALINNKFGEGE